METDEGNQDCSQQAELRSPAEGLEARTQWATHTWFKATEEALDQAKVQIVHIDGPFQKRKKSKDIKRHNFITVSMWNRRFLSRIVVPNSLTFLMVRVV